MLRNDSTGQLDVVNVVILVVVAGAVMYMGLTVLSSTAEQTGGDQVGVQQFTDQRVIIQQSGVYTDVMDKQYDGRNPTVTNSLGNAGVFDGSGGATGSSGTDVVDSDGTWTLSQTVWVNSSSTSSDMMLFTAGAPDAALAYNGTRGEWVGFVVEPSGITAVNATATDPTNQTTVTIVRDGSNVTIYEGGTPGENDTVGAEPVTMTQYGNFSGRLDETKIAKRAVTSSEASAMASDPVIPTVERANMSARIMWDQTSDGVTVYFSGGTLSAVPLGDGSAGTQMDRAGLIADNDYRWKNTGPQLLATSSGRLADHPAAWVSFSGEAEYGYGPTYQIWESSLSTVFSTIANLLPLLALFVILSYLALLRGR